MMYRPVAAKGLLRRGFLLFTAGLASASCGGDTAPVAVGSISITASSTAMPAGSSVQLTATVKSTSGEPMPSQGVAFQSSAPGIATVSFSGVVTSVGPAGIVTITASVGSVHSSIDLTVGAAFPKTLTRTSSDPGEIRAGATVGDSVRYLAKDAYGNPTPHVTIAFIVTEGGGEASPTSAETDALGRAATRFTTGLSSGKNTLSANMSGIAEVALSLTTVAGSVFISSVSPGLIVPGSTVTITGSGFDPSAGGDAVTIDGVAASVASASPTQLVVTAPAQLPCAPTHEGRVQVTTVDGTGIGAQMVRAGTLRTVDIGATVLLPEGAETICTELSPAAGRYSINVLNLSTVTAGVTPFHFTGATSPPPGGTLNVVTPLLLRQSVSAPSPVIRTQVGAPLLPLRSAAHFTQLENNRRIYNQMRKTFRRDRAAKVTPGVSASVALAPPPEVGTTRTFRVLQPSTAVGATGGCSNYVEITARVVYVGSKAIVYEDTKAPLAGQMDSYFAKLGQEFDATMYPSDSTYFGDPLVTDPFTDNDQHLNMVFTPSIPSTIAGFVTGCDFFSRTASDPASNFGENFYATVPTVAGTGFSSNTADYWLRGMRPTIVHEVKHIASVGAHLTNNASTFEESWLEEGMAMTAEEVWARDWIYPGATWKANLTYANTLFCDVRPFTTACNTPPYVMYDHFGGLYGFLDVLGGKSLFGRVADNDFSFYYATWSFIRYNADRYASSEAAFLRGITQATDQSGMANMSRQTGANADQMFANWSLALALDESSVGANPDINFPSWNSIDVFAGMNRDFPNSFPKTFPLVPIGIFAGDFIVDHQGIHGGSFASYDLTGANASTRTISLSGAGLRLVIVRRQ